MEYVKYTDKSLFPEVCESLVKAKLYVYKVWQLYSLYTKEQHRIKTIAVAYENGNPVGAAVYFEPPLTEYNVSVFVNKNYRRLGIGTAVIKLLEVENPRVYRVGSRKKFWNNVIGDVSEPSPTDDREIGGES